MKLWAQAFVPPVQRTALALLEMKIPQRVQTPVSTAIDVAKYIKHPSVAYVGLDIRSCKDGLCDTFFCTWTLWIPRATQEISVQLKAELCKGDSLEA